jgi:hypothetical protein
LLRHDVPRNDELIGDSLDSAAACVETTVP